MRWDNLVSRGKLSEEHLQHAMDALKEHIDPQHVKIRVAPTRILVLPQEIEGEFVNLMMEPLSTLVLIKYHLHGNGD